MAMEQPNRPPDESSLSYTAGESGLIRDAEWRALPPRAADYTAAYLRQLQVHLDSIGSAPIPLGELKWNVDHSNYQRDPSKDTIKKITSDLNWAALGTPLVHQRADISYWVLDGQNRIESLYSILGPHAKVRCTIIRGLTLEEEAYVFMLINATRLKLTPLDLWRAALKAGDPAVLDIARVLAELNLSIGRGKSPREFRAVGAVRGIYGPIPSPDKREEVRRVLRLVLDTWGKPEEQLRDALTAMVLNGTNVFLARYGDYVRFKREDFVTHVGNYRPKQLVNTAEALNKGTTLRASPASNFASALWSTYNESERAANKLPEWNEDERRRGVRHGRGR